MSTCRHCGRPEAEHCQFEAMQMPPGCQCDPKSWSLSGHAIRPQCQEFVGEPGGYCVVCEHDEICHTVAGHNRRAER